MGRGTTRRDVFATAVMGAAGLAACSRAQEIGDEAKALGEAAEAAERVLGVEYTAAEREQLVNGLEDQLNAVAVLRDMAKPNDLAPAQVFDPRLQGVSYPAADSTADIDLGVSESPPATDDDIAFAPAWVQAQWLRTGALSSRALTDIYLKRIERFAPRLECFVTTVDVVAARAEADARDRERAEGRVRGPLHGLPYGVKDLFDAEGLPTTWGAAPYKDRPAAAEDSAVVAKLREAGAVLLGKTTCGAIAYGDIWFGGVTRNPFNLLEGSSGSSAGSASGTAAGLMSFSIGTETLGSIVSPSHRCGTTGLRPTFGRVSRHGGMALCWSLDKVGPICRSARDTALVLQAINGRDPRDAGSLDHGFAYDGRLDVRGLRVGFDPRWFEDADPLDAAARDAARDAGVDLVEVAMPEVPGDQLVLALVVEAAAAFEDLTLKNLDDDMVWQEDRAWPNSFRQIRYVSAVDYVQIDRVRRRLMQEMHAAFGQVDALIGPNFAGGMLTATNFTGQPQLSYRAGFREREAVTLFGRPKDESGTTYRTPYNSSLWAPLFEEARIVRLAEEIETRLGVAGERPDLA